MSQGTTKGVPIDVDGSLTQNSDLLVPSQKAVKTYVGTAINAITPPVLPKPGRLYWGATQSRGTSGALAGFGTQAGVQRMDSFDCGVGQVAFTASGTPISGCTTFVALNGSIMKVADYGVSGSTLTLGTAPGVGNTVTWGYFTTAMTTGTVSIESFTGAGSTDFTLGHTPTFILLVALEGLVQPTTAYSIIGSTTLRFASLPGTGAIINITYLF